MKQTLKGHLRPVCGIYFNKLRIIFMVLFFSLSISSFAQTITASSAYGCVGNNIIFTLNGAYATAWNGTGSPTPLFQPGASDVTYSWSTPGNYVVIATTTTGAHVYFNFTIYSNTATMTVATTPATPICRYVPITFTATAGPIVTTGNFVWKLNGTVISGANTNVYSTSSLPVGTNTVSCIFTSDASCITFPSGGVVTVNTTIVVNDASPDFTLSSSAGTTICANTSTTLTASVGTSSYTWTSLPANNSLVQTTGTSVTAFPHETTTYTAVTGASPCQKPQSITITVNPNSASSGSACSPPSGTTGGSFAGSTNTRVGTPVVISASNATPLNGYNATDLVGFIYNPNSTAANKWEQIPIQVDERKNIDAGTIYNTTSYIDGYNFYGHDANGNVDLTQNYYSTFSHIQYCDPNTWVGADSNTLFDADADGIDELVFMARDAGSSLPPTSPAAPYPLGVAKVEGVKITITDPLNSLTPPSYVFIFKRSGTMLDPSAGKSYVKYDFKLSDYNGHTVDKTNYGEKLWGDLSCCTPLNSSGPNLETSTVVTPYYSTAFSDRWIQNNLKITIGSSNQHNLLNKTRIQAAGENEITFSGAEGAFIANISGPIRGIRSYMGAASGPLTQREHVFYDQAETVTTYLRVHSMSGVNDFYDYNETSSTATINPGPGPMLYNNNNNTAANYTLSGLTGSAVIDGSPDSITPGVLTWELINSYSGSIFRYYIPTTDFDAQLKKTTYYIDNLSNSLLTDPQYDSTDPILFGASGFFVNQALNASPYQLLPITDPRNLMLQPYMPTDATYATYDHNKGSQKASLLLVNLYLDPNTPLSKVTSMTSNITNPLTTAITGWSTTNLNDFSIKVSPFDVLPGNTIKYYPNPTSGIITIDVSGELNTDKITVMIYNSKGQKIYTGQSKGKFNERIDLQASAGIGQLYVAKITVGSKQYYEKILVDK